MLGIRRTLCEAQSWLSYAVTKRFEASKRIALERLGDMSATKLTQPFVKDQHEAARRLMGDDFWSYGLPKNRDTIAAFLRQHHAEGLSSRLLAPEELFHPAAVETHFI